MLPEETSDNISEMPPMHGVWESVVDDSVPNGRTLNMVHNMEFEEYEIVNAKLISVHKISSHAGLIGKFNKSFGAVSTAVAGFKSNDLQTYKNLSDSIEDFIKAVWHFREHTLTLLKDTNRNIAKYFSDAVSEMYDAGISYALIYKLRNYIEHHYGLPLHASLQLDDQGNTRTIIYLDSGKLIQAKGTNKKDVFNKKTRDYLLAHDRIEIIDHVNRVYIELIELVHYVFEAKLIDNNIADICCEFIEFFLEPDELHPALLLASFVPEDNPTPDSYANVKSAEFQLQYLRNVVKKYINNQSYLVPICYNPSALQEELKELPGLANIGSLAKIQEAGRVKINEVVYSAIASQFVLDKPMHGYLILCDERIKINELRKEIDTVIKCYSLLYKLTFLTKDLNPQS